MKRLLLFICALTAISMSQAQDKMWMHNPDRHSPHQIIDISDVETIDFNKNRMRFTRADGTTFTRTYAAKYDYYTFIEPERAIYKPNELKSMDFNDA